MCRGAFSGPRLLALIRIRISSARCFGVFYEHVEVPVVGEHTRVQQLVLGLLLVPSGILLNQPDRRDRQPGDTCTAFSCSYASGCCRGRSNIP